MRDHSPRLQCQPPTAGNGAGDCRWVAAAIAPFLLAASLLLGAGLGIAQEVSIKVLVNDDPISDYDIDQRTRFLAITSQQQPSPELKQQATDMLIDERLQTQEGRRQGATAEEHDVTAILEDMAKKNNLTVDGLATALSHAGVGIKTLKDRIRAQIAWQESVRRKFRNDIQIGEVDVDKAMSEAGVETGTAGATPAESALQLRQVKFEIPAGANQGTIAARLAAAERLRARFDTCADLAKGIDGASVKTLQDEKPSSLAQPARLLVTSAKVGQMTPPTITSAAVELYAVCGKRSIKGNDTERQTTQRKLMGQEMAIRGERLLRDLRQEAFIEYR